MYRSADGADAEGRTGVAASLTAALVALALALALAIAITGCDKKQDGGGLGPGPQPQPLPNSPTTTLLNMITAYEGRDSVGTEAVYDVAYEGTSVDLADPRPTITFTRSDERHHVGILKLEPNIVGVSLNFGPQSAWVRLAPNASDPPDWAVLQIDQANIQILDINTGTTHQAQNNRMTYTFIPTVAAPGDTTWKIRRWEEIRF
jgi:hypothetical protein